MAKKKNPESNFESKDRMYFLKGDKRPPVRILKSKGIFWYDESQGFERELMFTINQKTPFVDEFKGTPRRDQIVFKEGVLHVPKEKTVLQKLLSIYHPDLNRIYVEKDEEKDADTELETWEGELEAMNIAREMDIDKAEAIVRTEAGARVNKMSEREIRRDLYVLARKNPKLFIELANDENINIRNLGIKAVEQGILKLDNKKRTFSWGSNDRELFKIPFEENAYSALTAWFKTDEGVEVYDQVEKQVD